MTVYYHLSVPVVGFTAQRFYYCNADSWFNFERNKAAHYQNKAVLILENRL